MTQKLKSLKKYSKMIFAIALVATISAGCGSGPTPVSSGAATINVWMPFENSDVIAPLIAEYRKTHGQVNIVYTKKDITTYQEDLINALASGKGPDIYAIHNDWLPQFLDKATSSPEKYFTYKDFKDTFVDVVVRDFTKDKKIYGVAMSVDTLGLFYNKDLLGSAGIANPPKTWDELAADVQKIKRLDSRGYFSRSGVAIGNNAQVNRAVDILSLFMLQRGTIFYNDNFTQPTFSQTVNNNGTNYNPGLEALEFYTSFANPQSPNYNWNARSDYSIDAFVNGRAAFLYSYSYTRETILQKSPNLNFDVAEVPQPNLVDPKVNFANYWGLVVNKQSKAPNTSWGFLQFLTSKTILDKYYAQTKNPASRKDLIELQVGDPDIGVFAKQALTAKSVYKPDQIKLDNIFGQIINNVILNGYSPEEALVQAERQVQTLTRE